MIIKHLCSREWIYIELLDTIVFKVLLQRRTLSFGELLRHSSFHRRLWKSGGSSRILVIFEPLSWAVFDRTLDFQQGPFRSLIRGGCCQRGERSILVWNNR